MTSHYQDLGSASDWLKQIPFAARSSRPTTTVLGHPKIISYLGAFSVIITQRFSAAPVQTNRDFLVY